MPNPKFIRMAGIMFFFSGKFDEENRAIYLPLPCKSQLAEKKLEPPNQRDPMGKVKAFMRDHGMLRYFMESINSPIKECAGCM